MLERVALFSLVSLVACTSSSHRGGDASVLPDAANEMDGSQTRLDAAVLADATPDAPPRSCDPITLPTITTERIANDHNFSSPTFVTFAPGDSGALYVVERAGYIRRVSPSGDVALFLDMHTKLGRAPDGNDERGLLGLAFHPDYATNGRFFIGYTNIVAPAHNVVAEYHRDSGNPLIADATEVARFVETTDPEPNHNGGMLAFGPDGMLYAGIGDGGGAGDRHGSIGNGLLLTTQLGKILRLNVDIASPYIPEGNPFNGTDGLADIWAYGLRNPWRFSFDRETGDMYIGDVGQDVWEEIDFQAAGVGGLNYGWRGYEGTHVYNSTQASEITNHTPPVFEFQHSNSTTLLTGACSVTGGYVYRGGNAQLDGVYLLGDACSTDVVALRVCDNGARIITPQKVEALSGFDGNLVSFGEDEDGTLYLVYLGGEIFRVKVGSTPS